MALEIPESPKVYRRVYDNFKGVDKTNDASNVWQRRSPGGKNMLPALDERPYKRYGWKIDVPYTDFITAASSAATSVTPKRIHHFSLGGEDYMMIFNSLGVFYMSESSSGIHKCQLATPGTGGETYSAFPPQIDGKNIEADAGRAFFFEGAGSAGFYVYVGTELFAFTGKDDQNRGLFRATEPYVPRILVACDKYGVGSTLEPVNLMTRKRKVQYLCDGETTEFVVPQGAKGTIKVEIKNASGAWTELSSGWSYSNGVITFSEAPTVVVPQEDNMRIIYTPEGGYMDYVPGQEEVVTVETDTITRNATLTSYSTKEERTARYRSAKYTFSRDPSAVGGLAVNVTYGSWKTDDHVFGGFTGWNVALFDLVNPASTSFTVTPSGGKLSPWAYSGQYGYQPPESAYSGVTPTTKTDTTVETTSGRAISSLVAEARKTYMTTKKVPAAITATQWEKTTKVWKVACTATYSQYYTYSASTTKTVEKIYYDYHAGSGEYANNDASAFTDCQRAFVYGSGLFNQVFYTSSFFPGYGSRVWYSAADNPMYVPDTNYIEAGGDDTFITGIMKVSGYVGIIKQGSALDASVYLAYPTSFEEDSTFAVQQSINGVGAVSKGAFNILNEEPLFLSKEGVMGIEVSDQEIDRRIRSRSYFINGALTKEPELEKAVSFVHKKMYYLCVNNHCYVLDGAQKQSWMNEKTNLQYECYYLENIPAQCFSSMGDYMYFTDNDGNLCRFKTDADEYPYRDDYGTGTPDFTSSSAVADGKIALTSLSSGTPVENNTVKYNSSWYTITSVDSDYAYVTPGVPIDAVWDTISDDDGMVDFFKNLQKKGCLVSVLPGGFTSAKVTFNKDGKKDIYIGEASTANNTLPFEFYTKKKVKKYKRLQIIVENDKLDQGFGIDQIIKAYTIGNYSKNRG